MDMTQLLRSQSLAARAAFLLSMALLLTAPKTSQAQSGSDLGIASDFNVFIFGSVKQTDAIVKGRAAFGGGVDLSYFYVGENLTNSSHTRDDLIVAGDLNYQYGTVYNGNVRIGGNFEFGPAVQLPNGYFKNGNPIDFGAAQQDLRNQSNDWSGLAPDGTATVQGSSIMLNGSKDGLNVFSVSGADLSSAADIIINAPAGSTALINVSGTTIGMSASAFVLNGIDQQHVLYHFYEATTLTLVTNGNPGIKGTVFAPEADVALNGGIINGQLVAASLTGTGQFRHVPFSGAIGGNAGGAQSLPVELTRFEVVSDGQRAQLVWETATEQRNAGFEVQHATGNAESGDFQKRTFVEGHGTTLEAQRYSYTAAGLTPGTHRFRLKQVDFDGTTAYSPVVEVEIGMPEAYSVEPAYPNPFNPQTSLTYSVREAQHVTVSLYNMLGQRVRVLHEGMVQASQPQTVRIDGGSLASGTYLVRVDGEGFAQTQRITLVK